MEGIAFVWLNSSESQQEAAGEGRRWGHRSLECVDRSQQPLCTWAEVGGGCPAMLPGVSDCASGQAVL